MPGRRKDIDDLVAAEGIERDAARKRLAKLGVPTGEDLERKMRRLESEVKELRAAKAKLLQRLDLAEELRASVFGLANADTSAPSWPVRKAAKNRTPHMPILFTSDFQFGEVVTAAEMDGMNEFNAAIFCERYTRMVDKTLRWQEAVGRGWDADYPDGMIYLRGGDAISGEIHAELAESNDFGAVPAVRELVRYEAEGIRRLRDHYGRVKVISIPGNHGRTTIKPRHKGYANTNYETILAWWLESLFDGDKTVSFVTPPSGYARFEVYGWRFEMRHGDRMGAGGGVGWIGAPAPITKGHKKIRVDAASVGSPVDYVLTGHLHTSMQLPHGWANGCMPGYNEFARSLGLEPDCAKQWLIMVPAGHQPYGIELFLSDPPRRKE